MRCAVACLPAPRSASSNTGTSLCASSRMTASTGRMLALAPSTNFVTTPSMAISQLAGIGRSPQPRDDLPIFPLPVVSPRSNPSRPVDRTRARHSPNLQAAMPQRQELQSCLFFNNLHYKTYLPKGDISDLRLPSRLYAG